MSHLVNKSLCAFSMVCNRTRIWHAEIYELHAVNITDILTTVDGIFEWHFNYQPVIKPDELSQWMLWLQNTQINQIEMDYAIYNLTRKSRFFKVVFACRNTSCCFLVTVKKFALIFCKPKCYYQISFFWYLWESRTCEHLLNSRDSVSRIGHCSSKLKCN